MTKTIVALYHDLTAAHDVVQDLTGAEFDRENISVITSDPEGEYEQDVALVTEGDAAAGSSPREGAAEGSLAGGLIGGIAGLLFGVAAITIPGVGPAVVFGPLYTAAMGAGVGGISGGLLGALTEQGIPDRQARYHVEGIRRGYTLVAVKTDEGDADRVAAIMEAHNPVDLEREVEEWRAAGWDEDDKRPDQFVPSEDDTEDQYKYATGAMGSDLTGERASRDRPPFKQSEINS